MRTVVILALSILIITAAVPAPAQDSLNVHTMGYLSLEGEPVDLILSGNHAFVADVTGFMRVVDISNPGEPSLVSSLSLGGETWCLADSGALLAVANRNTGLKLVDITDPATPAEVGSLPSAGETWDVAVQGSYAYLADGSAGLRIVDISTPSSPSVTGTLGTAGTAYDVAVEGDYAYVTDWTATLNIINISDPANPTLTATNGDASDPYDVQVEGGYAYLGDDAGLRIVNCVDPTSPFLASTLNLPAGNARRVGLIEGYAVLSADAGGVRIADVSDPGATSWAGWMDMGADDFWGAVAGPDSLFAYAVTRNVPGFIILDISYLTFGSHSADPFQLLTPADGDTVDSTTVTLTWEAAHDPNPSDPVRYFIYMDTDPEMASPNIVGFNRPDTFRVVEDLTEGTWYYWTVFVPDREEEGTWAPDTLSFLVPEANDVAPANPGLPERFAIEGAWPNPFNAATTLKLALPTPGTVQIALYDLLGREVARLARGEIAAGRHKIALDGSRLASGTYLVRALGPAGQRALQRVTLVK